MSNDQPIITVVSGSPTPEEMAAIITVLAAAGSQGPAEVHPREHKPSMGGWKSYVRTLRKSFYPGPGAWRHGDR